MTADEALAAWLAHLAHERRLSPRTLEAYGHIGRLYVAFLEHHRGEALSLRDMGTITAAEVRAHRHDAVSRRVHAGGRQLLALAGVDAGDEQHIIGGAQLFLVQTNNATFGYTAESTQQLAISRLRALEYGRSIIHVSTVGVSGFVNPDGSTTPVTQLFTAAQPVDDVVLRSGLTVSDRLGPWVEWGSALVLLLAVVWRLRRRPTGSVGDEPRSDQSPTEQTEEATTGA